MHKSEIQQLFGASVKAWRNRLGISQEDLAERSNLHRTYISDVERGARNLSLESISRLARALDVSVSTLFPETVEIDQLAKDEEEGDCKYADILLVEDNSDDVDLTLHVLSKARFANRIHVASDGQEALDYLFCQGDYAKRNPAERPVIILLDLFLPTMPGLEVLRQIKADERTRSIPVVVLTISHVFDDFKECERLGAKNYIIKPLDFKKLSQITPQLRLNWALLKPGKNERREIRT